jgi:hypothetical protein
MTLRIAATLNAKDAGDLTKALAGISVTDTKTIAMLGTIIGMSDGLSYRANPYGDEPAIALTGVFEAMPFDPEGVTVQSASLFLPKSVQDILVKAAADGNEHAVTKAPKRGQKVDVPAKQLKVMCEVGIRRTTSKDGDSSGYEYIVNLIGEQQKIDVLESLRAEIAGGATTAIPARAADAQIAKPAAKAATPKAKRK